MEQNHERVGIEAYNMLKKPILAIIPARKGSERLPNKHVLEINNKNLIDLTAEQITDSGLNVRTIMTTDSEQLIKLGKQKNWEAPYIRPAYLSTSTANTVSVIEHTLKHLKAAEGTLPELLLLLQLTSPLRTGAIIRKAVNKILKNQNLDAIVSMRRINIPPANTFVECSNKTSYRPLKANKNLRHFLVPNGALYLIRTDIFEKTKTLFPKNTSPLVMNDEESIDIDTAADWAQLRAILAEKKRPVE